jgi:hypothetical protein
MGERRGAWSRIRGLFRPEPETYETRRARASGEVTALGPQLAPETDPRRHGGTTAIGS